MMAAPCYLLHRFMFVKVYLCREDSFRCCLFFCFFALFSLLSLLTNDESPSLAGPGDGFPPLPAYLVGACQYSSGFSPFPLPSGFFPKGALSAEVCMVGKPPKPYK